MRILCLGILSFSHTLKGQAIGNIMPGYQNTVSFAGSYGGTFDGQAWLWGISADYSHFISKNLILSSSVAFDQETGQLDNNMTEVNNTISFQFALGHMLNQRVSVGAGFAKGMFGNNDATSTWNLKDFGKDWTIGVLGSYTFWYKGPHSLDIATSLEYRINEKKASYSFDLGYGFSF